MERLRMFRDDTHMGTPIMGVGLMPRGGGLRGACAGLIVGLVLITAGLAVSECSASVGLDARRIANAHMALAAAPSVAVVHSTLPGVRPLKMQPRRPALPTTHRQAHIKTVMLTFDDGPHPQFTPKILAVLRKFNVKATFFVVGKVAARHPELIRAIAADGHVVANHSYDHRRLSRAPERIDISEMQRCSEIIQSITGTRPAFFRPPGGHYDRNVVDAASQLRMKVVSFTVNTFDTIDSNRFTIAARVVRDVRSGGIVLCHDGFQQTIDALPSIIKRLHKKGYTFTTLADVAPHKR